jgi:hypothetical protein
MTRIQSRVVIAGEPVLIDGANRVTTLRIPARTLQPGDCVGSGETVVSVSAGVATPAGKVDVILERAGRQRSASWGASTLIGASRAPTLPGIAPVTTRERLEHRASAPMRATVAQAPLDVGLFGSGRDQLDLVDAARAAQRKPD